MEGEFEKEVFRKNNLALKMFHYFTVKFLLLIQHDK
jgi:hypothetical protein